MKITLTKYLLEMALIGCGWPEDIVRTLTEGFDSGGAKRFAQNFIDMQLTLYHSKHILQDLRMFGCGILADKIEMNQIHERTAQQAKSKS